MYLKKRGGHLLIFHTAEGAFTTLLCKHNAYMDKEVRDIYMVCMSFPSDMIQPRKGLLTVTFTLVWKFIRQTEDGTLLTTRQMPTEVTWICVTRAAGCFTKRKRIRTLSCRLFLCSCFLRLQLMQQQAAQEMKY